ncbi:MAG: type I methionyl aminopeptidase [Acidimicrobiaceae bacterium]|nr:type I methionyl aminopeptidase [Acidimicrobiaceae bacterium]
MLPKRKRRASREPKFSNIPASDPQVVRGLISPRRFVPTNISRPRYVFAPAGEAEPEVSPLVRTEDELQTMRRTGFLAAEMLIRACEQVRVGVTTDSIDRFVHDAIVEAGAYPSPLGYRGYPKSICTSVNEVICHGIPDSRSVADGDIINIDITVYREMVHCDTSVTLMVGEVDDHSKRLVTQTCAALFRGIAAVKAGAAIREIGRAIQNHAHEHGLGVVREFVGHGIGTEFHSGLQIPHYYDRSASTLLVDRMTFTIEPMLTLGSPRVMMWDDGWTAITEDGLRTAQFEHTLACEGDDAEIITQTSAGESAHEIFVEPISK